MDDEMFTVTKAWIEQHRTPKGAWTSHQLALIEVVWPPVKGWKDRAVGLRIPYMAKAVFEAYGRESRQPTQSPMDTMGALDQAAAAAVDRDRT